MLTNEERIAAMHDRAAVIEQRQRGRRVKIIQSAAAACSFAAVVLLAMFMPQLAALETQHSGAAPGEMNASIFAGTGAYGYVVIAIVAFLLGMTVTAFCFRLRKWQEQKNAAPGAPETVAAPGASDENGEEQ